MQDYSWKRMECKSVLARFNEFSFSDKHAICLNSRIRELEGSVAQTIICRGIRGTCPGLQRAGPSMLCNMLGERSQKSLHLLILRDLPPHLFLYLLLFKRKIMVETNMDSTNFEHQGVYTLFKKK